MYEILDNKVIRRETSETITEVSSSIIQAEIYALKESYDNIGKQIDSLNADLIEVLNLEAQLK